MCYVIIKDNIYYVCFVHNHIGIMNKLLRKIVFTDMAIRNTGSAICALKKLGRNISCLAICVKKNPGCNITWLAV